MTLIALSQVKNTLRHTEALQLARSQAGCEPGLDSEPSLPHQKEGPHGFADFPTGGTLSSRVSAALMEYKTPTGPEEHGTACWMLSHRTAQKPGKKPKLSFSAEADLSAWGRGSRNPSTSTQEPPPRTAPVPLALGLSMYTPLGHLEEGRAPRQGSLGEAWPQPPTFPSLIIGGKDSKVTVHCPFVPFGKLIKSYSFQRSEMWGNGHPHKPPVGMQMGGTISEAQLAVSGQGGSVHTL